jgi:hypothetical protein
MQEGVNNSITVMKGGYTEWVNAGRCVQQGLLLLVARIAV